MSAPNMPEAGSGWTVTGQTETDDLSAGGQFVSGVRVYFRTGNGVDGSVFLSHGMYTVDNVRAAIAAKVAQLDAVSNLSG